MSVHLSTLIPAHGYWLAFVGALLEGETVLVLAGLAAHRGYLSWPVLVALGAAGGFLGDQIGFAVGRRLGDRVPARFPRLAPLVTRIHALVLRHPRLSVIAVRFLYGMRLAGPIVIGGSRIAWSTFTLLNAAGALLWSACWVGAGWLAGMTIEAALGRLQHVEHVVFAAALAAAVVISVGLRIAHRRSYGPKARRSGAPPPPGPDR